jgi:SAM-dependent methyltransferase
MLEGERYYRDYYRDYNRQNPARKLDFYLGLVRRWAPRAARVHEIGTGLGMFLERAATEFRCTGSEVNDYGLATTKTRVAADVHSGSYDQIPRSPAPDVIVAWDVLEHIPDLDDALDCIRERLAPAGVLIAIVPVYDGPLGAIVRRLDRDPTHVSKWSRARWRSTLAQHHFDIVETGGVVRYLVAGRWYLHVTTPAALWRHIGSAFWFVARPRPQGTVAR